MRCCSWTCFGDCNLFFLLRPYFIFLIYQPGSSDNFLGCSLLQNQALNSGEKSVEASGLHPDHLTYSLDGHLMAPKNLPLAHMICAVVHVNKGYDQGSLIKAIGVFQHVPLWIIVLSCRPFFKLFLHGWVQDSSHLQHIEMECGQQDNNVVSWSDAGSCVSEEPGYWWNLGQE